ncbi:virulence RhuM family protein [uncultured Kushneria sp.]|uniref:virulence RhuM family protein n=1 Tax=uncultured Kushneria sp. TaxID=905033 RepID=UPI00263067CE|nr:virulence RhuM family protein [uncultured Kushneria sp.]
MKPSELILYRSDDGQAQVHLRADGDTAWLTQADIAELFETSKQNVSLHVRNILNEGELLAESVIKESLTTAGDGKRYRVKWYNLPMILAVGYRVRSPRGTQFRQWATAHLNEYLVKGFVMDDQRLKEPGGWDYFDELLARIRDIRASEKRFYQKVRDLFALSSDYQPKDAEAALFFAEVQNKLLYAVTERTAAEIVVERADSSSPNMALTSWKGTRVRKQDVVTAKNYLVADEIETLNRLVTLFIDQAELRARDRRDLTLDYWRDNVDRLLAFSERPILDGAGSISAEQARRVAHQRYETFDEQRKKVEAEQADKDDLEALQSIEHHLRQNNKQ